ncbi:MAG: DNA gyrase subunit B [Phycisphaerae bacterium]|nr:DNA gyrase subunit B [Phycisphaerae bacterium]|tara:strand:+ start:5301 stop:7805 length:2505 start_codon:yes stop_codon:yes gene_type:complete
MTQTPDTYTSEQIQVLEGLEAIRKRPGMYVGGTGLGALHHLVYECVDNAIDEVMANFATTITVRIGVDGSCTVIDDGRGMPVDEMKSENPLIDGRPAVEVIMTQLHAGGKFDDNAYKVSGGLHGVGVKCVNALSIWTRVEVVKETETWMISFSRGDVSKPLQKIEDYKGETRSTGTRISFLPDPEIFPDTVFRYESLEHRLRELAFLNPGVAIRFIDERVDKDGKIREETFYSEKGLADYVSYLNRGKNEYSSPIALSYTDEETGTVCDIAMQYTDATSEVLLAFGNNIVNPDGGTHVSGFKTSLTRTVNAYAKRNKLIKGLTPSGDDLREGLTTIISVKLTEPQFNNQTKEKLLNPEVESIVSSLVSKLLGAWLEEHPSESKKICLKAILAAQAREAARKARDLIKRKGALESGGMPQKLADCVTNDVDRSELFIVEGDSAGGSAKGGRDHDTQAILPLKGKILNVEKARIDKVLGFEEIRVLIQALQCGIGEDFDISKLRYGRIVIMTDADVDGSHIRTLLLTFFFRQMGDLIRQGKIYIAQPPLYQVTRNKKSFYVNNENEMTSLLMDMVINSSSLIVRDKNGEETQRIEAEELGRVTKQLSRLSELINIAERRGTPFNKLLALREDDPESKNRLPRFRVVWMNNEVVCWDEEEARKIIAENDLLLDDMTVEESNVNTARIAALRELHENREIDAVIDTLNGSNIDIKDYFLTQEVTVSGELLSTKYAWSVDANSDKAEVVNVPNIPDILESLRQIGRRGIEIKRFKGLGEMNPEELWDTTMDPEQRTMLRVTWDAASDADQLFTTLMGEQVECRRKYIEDHALEVKNLDI